MKTIYFRLVLVTSFFAFAKGFAQQDEAAQPSFAQVVSQNFSHWDSNGDGVLSEDEILAAVANPKVQGDAAAAIAAIEKVVRGKKYTLPAITKDYLVSSPLTEPKHSDEQAGSEDDISKSEKFENPPAFQPRYLIAMRKLRLASRDLFPQGLPSFDATHQGTIGDCPFVSTVGAMVYRNPSAVKAMFTQNTDGSTTVSFGNGQSIKIVRLTDADIAIWSSAGTNGLWFTILEKAYRRMLIKTSRPDQQDRPSIYDKFSSSRTIEILDGYKTRSFPLKKIRANASQLSELRQALVLAQSDHRLIKAGTPSKKSTPGITPDHAYAILGYDKTTDVCHVWNPHGNNFTPEGSDSLQNGYTTKRGEFDIPLKDLIQIFADVSIETSHKLH